MDVTTAISMNWPILALCAVGLVLLFVVLKGSMASLQRTFAEMRERQEKIGAKVNEMDRRLETIGKQHADVLSRITEVQSGFESLKAAAGQQLAALEQRMGSGDDSVVDSPAALDRFNAASDTLSQVAKELESFDARHSESWLRIKGDLDEQGFQLQRVRQHFDSLFPSASAPGTTSVN